MPAWENQASNPYTAIIADGLVAAGWRVHSPSAREGLRRRADIVHIHWPQKVFGPSTWRSAVSAAAKLAFLARQKLAGAKLIWTTHNVVSHESHHPRLERLYMALYTRWLDGFISLSEHDRDQALAAFPALRRVPHAIIPHSVYGGRYPQPAVPRPSSGAHRTIAFLGDIKPYKGLDALLDALAGGVPDGHRYVVAGKCADTGLARAYAARIADLVEQGWTIEWDSQRLSDQALVDALTAADLLVLPYRRGENSGLAVLAAELGVPLLMSDVPAFRALRAELGEGGATLYEGSLRQADIAAALHHFAAAPRQAPAAFLERRSHVTSAALTAEFYRRLLDRQDSAAG